MTDPVRTVRSAPSVPGPAEAVMPVEDGRFRALIENSYNAIALLGAEGVIQYASPSSTRVLGYAPEELVGPTGKVGWLRDIARVIFDADEKPVRMAGAAGCSLIPAESQSGSSSMVKYVRRRSE